MFEYFERSALNRGFFLHAVAVVAPRGAVLILGHSGAGKTTLSRLLAEKFPPVMDDFIYIAKHKNSKKWYICDSKKMSISPHPFMPLLATLRTYQAHKPQLTRLSPREACRDLTDAVFEIELMRSVRTALQARAFVSAAEISRNYSGWRLFATLDSETPRLVWDCFST
jgi:ABC-type glutathione transport system ATPase component